MILGLGPYPCHRKSGIASHKMHRLSSHNDRSNDDRFYYQLQLS